MQRVMIVVQLGSGKSTVAREIAQRTGQPAGGTIPPTEASTSTLLTSTKCPTACSPVGITHFGAQRHGGAAAEGGLEA